LVVDAGGLLGGFLGFGIYVIARSGIGTGTRTMSGVTLAGAAVGLGAAMYFTKDWDVPDSIANIGILPLRDGALATVRFDL
jgi:hypothetical protein